MAADQIAFNSLRVVETTDRRNLIAETFSHSRYHFDSEFRGTSSERARGPKRNFDRHGEQNAEAGDDRRHRGQPHRQDRPGGENAKDGYGCRRKR